MLKPYRGSIFCLTEVLRLAALPLPWKYARLAMLFVILSIHVYLLFWTTAPTPAENGQRGYLLSMQALTASDFLVLADAKEVFSRVHEPKYAELSVRQRISWIFDLSYNTRGIGWNFEAVKAHPPHPTASRWSFIAFKFTEGFLCWLVLDGVTTVFRDCTDVFRDGSMTEHGIALRVVIVGMFWVISRYSLVMTNCAAACVFVGLGVTQPSYWPNLFGSWTQAYSLRKFWGRSWHQLMRHYLLSHARLIGYDVLKLDQHGRYHAYIEMYLAFFISGLIHVAGSWAMMRRWEGVYPAMVFFLLQAILITVEDEIVAFGRRRGIEDGAFVRAMGFLWTAFWFVVTTPMWGEPMYKAGALEVLKNPKFSVFRGLLHGEWLLPS